MKLELKRYFMLREEELPRIKENLEKILEMFIENSIEDLQNNPLMKEFVAYEQPPPIIDERFVRRMTRELLEYRAELFCKRYIKLI